MIIDQNIAWLSELKKIKGDLKATDYTKEKVKIIFDKKGILSKMQNQNDFHKLQITLNRLGLTSYDMS